MLDLRDSGPVSGYIYFPFTGKPEKLKRVELIIQAPGVEPVTLRLNGFYGACREVCVSVEAEATVTLKPGEVSDPVAQVAVERYRP